MSSYSSIFTPASSVMNPFFHPPPPPNPYLCYHEVQPDFIHPYFNQYKHLLSYRFKNDQGFVRTAYLYNVSAKMKRGNQSEDEFYYYYVYQRIVKQFYDSTLKKWTSSRNQFELAIIGFILGSIRDLNKNIRGTTSTNRRNLIKYHFFGIFDFFNKELDKIDDILNPDFTPIELKMHPRVAERLERELWIRNHQDMLRRNLVEKHNPPKRRGRPRKTQIYHPDLYGF